VTPRTFHFVFGLRNQTEPFHIAHYLCLRSCLEVNEPDRIVLHHHHEPYGPWWDRIRPELELRRVEPHAWVRDHPAYLEHDEGLFIQGWDLGYAHQADFIRLQLLIDEGGVYADMDTLFVDRLPDSYFAAPFVIGKEDASTYDADRATGQTLCNAFLVSEPSSVFAREWLKRMYDVFDGTWSRHSCEEASLVAADIPDEVLVVDQRHHFMHPCSPEGLASLFERRDDDLEGVYSFHLWAHMWWSRLRTDMSMFHAGDLTEDYVRTADTTYAVTARRFLS